MAWSSILPESFSTVETWAARTFVLLGLLTIGPWILVLVYDVLLYLWRAATYEVPILGGKARGRQPPTAPSFSQRPSGHRRRFSLVHASDTSDGDTAETERVRQRQAYSDDQMIKEETSEDD